MNLLWISVTVLVVSGCASEKKATPPPLPQPSAANGVTSVEPWLPRYDLKAKRPRQTKLPGKISEISGLAITSDGRLLCHDDESAVVYEIDPWTGKILAQYSFGNGFLEDDFEGIAVKEDTVFVVNSSGDIFQFRQAPDRGHASFKLFKTSLSQKNDIEGLEFDPVTDCLLLACKGDAGKGLGGFKAVYAFSLTTRRLIDSPRFLIPLKEVNNASKGTFCPSGIAIHPLSGTIFVISADSHAVVELDRHGRILAQEEIPRNVNSQPEGIAFMSDGTMILANDGQGGAGTITMYPTK